MKAKKIARIIENVAPLSLAESWDNPGFQIGDRDREVKRVLTTLDITPEVLKFASENEIDMILSHHPFFFRGLKSIDLKTKKGKMIRDSIKNNLILYSAHTNLDKAENGLNTFVAKKLGLKNIKPLVPEREKLYKFSVFVPEENAEEILTVLEENGAGDLGGNYDNCSFITSGRGRFRAKEEANPSIGEIGVQTDVKEVKIESVIKKKQLNKILSDLKRVHPYEEFAYDLIEDDISESKEGLGSIGTLSQSLSAEDFLKKLSEELEISKIREAGPRPERIKKVALCTGAGAEFIPRARRADVYITGDLKHHDAQRAEEEGLWVLDCSHFGTEKFVTRLFKNILKDSDELEVLEYTPETGYLKEIQI